MKKTFLIILSLAGITSLKSQTVTPVVLANDGGYAPLSNGSISWSIGEPVSETYTGSNNILTMGFHQPEMGLVNLIQEQGEDVKILVFPNPVKDVLSVNLKGLKVGQYTVELNDAIGKLIYRSQTDVTEDSYMFQLKVNEAAAGNYFLRVSNKDLTKTVKITKVN